MPLVWFSVWPYAPLHPRLQQRVSWHGREWVCSLRTQMGSGCLWDQTGFIALHSTGQIHGLWKQGEQVWSSWLCPTGQRPFSVRDTVSLPSSRSKTNQIIQDVFSTVRAEHQAESSGMKRNADLHQKAKYKPIACHRFSFFFPLFMSVT